MNLTKRNTHYVPSRSIPILFLCLLSVLRVAAQDSEPAPLELLDYARYTDVLHDRLIPQNKFVLGWNWGDSPSGAASDALSMNLWHGGTNSLGKLDSRGAHFVRDQVTERMDMMWVLRSGATGNPNAISANHNEATILQGMAMHYDPTVSVQENGEFAIPASNPEAGSFGFLTKNYGTVEQVDGKTAYVVRRSTPANAVVLAKPWPFNRMFELSIGQIYRVHKPENYNGQKLYLAINLRRLSATLGNVQDNTPVLRMRVPYRISPNALNNPSYIQFTALSPNTSTYSSIRPACSIAGNRGYAIEPIDVSGSVTEFVITRNMLPKILAGNESSITLYAFMILDDISNAKLRTEFEYSSTSRITELGIEVQYLGNEDVAINWARFETPAARALFRGEHDCTIRDALASDLEHLRSTAENPKRARIYRVYGIDECRPQQFWAMRYFNKLLGGLATTERATDFDQHYEQIVQPHENWVGTTTYHPYAQTAPYYPTGWRSRFGKTATLGQQALCMGITRGYSDGKDILTQPRASLYETNTYGHYVSTLAELRNVHEYGLGGFVDICRFSGGTLLEFELQSVYGFYKEDMAHQPGSDIQRRFLYSGKPWYANMWAFTGFQAAPHPTDAGRFLLRNHHHRPKTGEELRAFVWQSLILGAKGLVYYKAESPFSEEIKDGSGGEIGIADDKEWLIKRQVGESDVDFLRNRDGAKEYGGDFLLVDEKSKLDKYIDWDNTAASLGVSRDRLYLGRKSLRLEIRKIHDKILTAEKELLPLRLQAWFGKGIKETFSYATGNDILDFNQTVNKQGVKTRQIRRVNSSGQPEYEPWDSTFVDITMLENPNEKDVFYIGVLNRRADPVVAWSRNATPATPCTPLGTNGDIQYTFYSTEEFDNLVRNGVLDDYAQLGAREITVPFVYQYKGGKGEPGYALLHVEELGGGGIDTVIGQDRLLAMNFLPGEGKLLKVTVLKPDETEEGFLSYSNQRKMVVVVPGSGEPNNFRILKDRIYHMVYHKTIPGTNRMGVYYRRSVAQRKSNNDNIQWEVPILLSERITHEGIVDDRMDCAYPSIVVRDEDYAHVYVVYSCTGGKGEIINYGPAGSPQMAIVENMFSATNPYGGLDPSVGRVLTITSGSDDKSVWGTPVVNASANGQYYTWSDYDRGIGVGFKPSGILAPLTNVKTFSWQYGYGNVWGIKPNCTHPCVNTYSRIGEGEDECAVVWQEYDNIYYARLKHDANTNRIIDYRLPTFNNSWEVLPTAHNNTMMRLSQENCTGSNRMPVIYRGLEAPMFWQLPPSPHAGPSRRDVVFWEGNPNGVSTSRIYTRVLDIVDDIATNTSYWNVYPMGSIWGVSWNFSTSISELVPLKSPDLAQGVYIPQEQVGIESANKSDSAFVTNFVWKYRNNPETIIQMPFNLFSPLLQRDNSFWGLNGIPWLWWRPMQVVEKHGRTPQLAARRYLQPKDINEWREIRRVYEYLDALPPTILTSAQHFYKESDADIPKALLGPGYQVDCYSLKMTNVKIVEQGGAELLSIPFFIPTKTVVASPSASSRYALPDTLRSQPFAVGNMASLSLDIVGSNTSFVRMEIVRQSDGYREVIPLAAGTDTTLSHQQMMLTNGGGGLYTLEFMKTDPRARYVEDVILTTNRVDGGNTIEPLKNGSTGESVAVPVVNLARKGQGEQGVGLQAFVYPNPASDNITISVYRNGAEAQQVTGGVEKLVVHVVTAMGQEVATFNTVSGGSMRMETTHLASGIYFIRVESPMGGDSGRVMFTVKR